MKYFTAAIVLFLIFVLMYIREKRRFRNAIVLFAALTATYFGVAEWSYQTDHRMIYQIINGITFLVIPLSILALCVLLVVDTFVLLKREGKRLKNLLPLAVVLVLVGSCILTVYAIMGSPNGGVFLEVSILIAILLAYLSVVFLCFLIYNFVYSMMPKNVNADYIIIHGCGLLGGKKVTPLLASRVEKAMELYHKGNEQAILIASGGQGADEQISEAEAISGYMLQAGIPSSAIWQEKRSTTTEENLRYSREMIEAHQDGKPYKCLFVTNNYHVLRTSLLAKSAGLKGEGVGSKTKWYYWITAFLREYIAIVMRYKWVLFLVILFYFFLLVWSHMEFG